jgi:sialate O-acetylesterase
LIARRRRKVDLTVRREEGSSEVERAGTVPLDSQAFNLMSNRSIFAAARPRSLFRFVAASSVALILLNAAEAWAEVRLASPFTSHLVLQRELPAPVWGTAEPGERVVVRFAGQKRKAKAGSDGKWRVELKPLKASSEGRELVVTGSKTAAPITLADVLVGEVWLCSGQSNMDFTLAKTEKFTFAGVLNEAEEVAAANHPRIRMFTGEWQKSHEPAERVGGEWQVCTPGTAREFSAVGYFFARRVQQELDVPVGIVKLTFGASCAQAWVRREAMAADPRLAAELAKFDEQVAAFRSDPAAREKYETALAEWKIKADEGKAKGARAPRGPRNPDPVQDQHNPTVMFNGMVAPVIPYAIRGVLWYQGESITAPRELFPVWNETLIRDWRALWGRELPFFFVQLAGLDAKSNGPEVRALQAEALKLPQTGMAVTIDVGDKKDVHPRNKQAVGDRLARLALARTYGRDIADSGPTAVGVVREPEHGLRVRFSDLHGGLATRGGGSLGGFEIAGADGKFFPAEAMIDGEAVVVRATEVAEPAAVRYAWAGWPENANLVNAEELPAAPFKLEME